MRGKQNAGQRIDITTLIAMRNEQPYVVLTWGDKKAQMTIQEARDHAYRILEVAESAVGDGFVCAFFGSMPGATKVDMAECLQAFRAYRAQLEAKQREEAG